MQMSPRLHLNASLSAAPAVLKCEGPLRFQPRGVENFNCGGFLSPRAEWQPLLFANCAVRFSLRTNIRGTEMKDGGQVELNEHKLHIKGEKNRGGEMSPPPPISVAGSSSEELLLCCLLDSGQDTTVPHINETRPSRQTGPTAALFLRELNAHAPDDSACNCWRTQLVRVTW